MLTKLFWPHMSLEDMAKKLESAGEVDTARYELVRNGMQRYVMLGASVVFGISILTYYLQLYTAFWYFLFLMPLAAASNYFAELRYVYAAHFGVAAQVKISKVVRTLYDSAFTTVRGELMTSEGTKEVTFSFSKRAASVEAGDVLPVFYCVTRRKTKIYLASLCEKLSFKK